MDVLILIGIVATVTEIIKKGLLKIRVELKGQSAVILACLVSVGVVLVKAIQLDVPIGLGLIPVLVQVILGSTVGYSIITKK